ncbi:hypothetical protein JHK85_049754 [Glycine max]|nr:hypothetical protein JHK85_049754 [Glycine max]
MRALAAQFSNYLCRRKVGVNLRSRNFSSYNSKDELTIEEEAERKVGWLLKTIFFVTAGVAGYHFFPYMGENLMQQSVSLLRVKDPLFKRMGASRLARFAVDDEALASLHHAGAISVIRSAPNSLEDAEVEGFKLSLMKRFQDLRYDVPS